MRVKNGVETGGLNWLESPGNGLITASVCLGAVKGFNSLNRWQTFVYFQHPKKKKKYLAKNGGSRRF